LIQKKFHSRLNKEERLLSSIRLSDTRYSKGNGDMQSRLNAPPTRDLNYGYVGGRQF